MRLFELKTIVLGWILAFPVVVMAAQNCPDGNTDPNCPNHVAERGKKGQQPQSPAQVPAQQQAQQQAQQRAAQQQAQQQAQQRAAQQQAQQQQPQQQEQQRQQRLQQRAAQQQAQQQPQQQLPQRIKQDQPKPSAQGQTPGDGRRPDTARQRPVTGQTQVPSTMQGQPPSGVRQPGNFGQRQTAGETQIPQEQRVQQQAQQRQQRLQQRAAQQQAQQQSQQQLPQRIKQDQPQPSAQGQPPGSGRQPGTLGQRPVAGQAQVPPTAQGRPASGVRQPGNFGQRPTAGQTQAPPTAQGQPAGAGHQPGTAGQRPFAGSASGQRPNAAATGRRSPPAQAVAVDSATSVISRGDRSGFDIRRKNNDGSQVVITQKVLPDGTKTVSGFKQTENSRDGTSTRIYSDGRRVTQGRDFESRSVGNGMSFVSNRNGLRAAALPDGRPAFQDRFTSLRDRDGSQRQVIERTQYARWSNGRPEYQERPFVRQYDVGHIHGAPVAQYRPSRFAPDVYHRFHSRYAVPVVVAGLAAAAAWVAFDSGSSADSGSVSQSYTDPVALMGDMQIASGFEEGYAYAAPTGGTPVYDTPEAAALRSQMASVQQQVGSSIQANAALKQQLGGVDIQANSAQVQQAVGSAVPVQISEEVRQQVRKQVRLSVAMHQNARPLVLNDVMSSGYAKIYLFQTAQPLNVGNLSGAGECFLNTGDLISFSKLPANDSATAEMKVVASGVNSCRSGELVQVGLTDLQEMLNGFSERVEDNMKKVTACAASGRC